MVYEQAVPAILYSYDTPNHPIPNKPNTMSTPTTANIYTGPWIDWSQGAVLGSTITLSSRSALIFTAFLAFFITVVGACLWRILCFVIHQCSASPRPRTGQHHQHQLIFRNTSSPTEAFRAFCESAFFWRRSTSSRRSHSFARALPLAVFALVFSCALTAGSVLSSLVAKHAGSERLITSDNCGFFAYDNSSSLPVRTKAMVSRDLNETLIAAAYARQCYQGNDRLNVLQCGVYTVPALKYKSTAVSVACPFDDGMCLDGLAYQLDTGLVDTHKDLGVNMPRSGRVGFRKVTTCAPIVQRGFLTNHTSDGTDGLGLEGDRIIELHYGGIAGLGLLNTTYFYNAHALLDGWGYALESITASPNAGGVGWLPIDELARTDADISLVFLAANGMQFYESNTDPLFRATVPMDAGSTASIDASYFLSDNYVNVLGCTDQYQYCHPDDTSKCTPLTDYATAWTEIYNEKLGLNDVQQILASRIALNSRGLSIHHGISGRGASALRAQEYVSERAQLEIKPNQWHLEVDSWFDIGLAKLQRAIVEYATGPDFLPEGTYLQRPGSTDIISKGMCGSQMVRIASGTVSFSVLGIGIIFGVGSCIILTYLVLETVIGFLQRKLNWGDYRRVRWVMDDKLQVQRMAFEGAGMGGEWRNLSGNVPVTAAGDEKFAGLEHVDPQRPRWKRVSGAAYAQQMAQGWKGGEGEAASLESLQQQQQQAEVAKYDAPYDGSQDGMSQQRQSYQQVPQGSPLLQQAQMVPVGHVAQVMQQQQQQTQKWPLETRQPLTMAYERQSYQPAPSQSL